MPHLHLFISVEDTLVVGGHWASFSGDRIMGWFLQVSPTKVIRESVFTADWVTEVILSLLCRAEAGFADALTTRDKFRALRQTSQPGCTFDKSLVPVV